MAPTSPRVTLLVFLEAFVLAAVVGAQRPPSTENAQQAKPATQSPGTNTPQQAKPAAPEAKSATPESAEASAWKVLTDAATSEKTPTRSDAISALASIGPLPEVVQLIEARLADKDADVRVIAAASLGHIKSHASVPALQKALNDDSAPVSFAAAKALWEMHDHSGRDLFIAVLEGDRGAAKGLVRSQVDDAKKKLHSPTALALIGVNEGAGAFLGPFAMGITVAEALVKDNSAQARALSASLLGEDPSAESKQELQDALADKNWVVRAAAAQAIGNFSEPALIPQLEPLLQDSKEPVRYMAAASIVRLAIQRASSGPRPRKKRPASKAPPQ